MAFLSNEGKGILYWNHSRILRWMHGFVSKRLGHLLPLITLIGTIFIMDPVYIEGSGVALFYFAYPFDHC
jgi:hypothetical protein